MKNKTEKEKVYYRKLVRDKIPKIIENNGGECKIKILRQESMPDALKKKLYEEFHELLDAKSAKNILAEAADVIIVLTSLLECSNHSSRHLSRAIEEIGPASKGLDPKTTKSLLHKKIDEIIDVEGQEDILYKSAKVVTHLQQLMKKSGFKTIDLNNAIKNSTRKKGGFKKGYFLVWATAK